MRSSNPTLQGNVYSGWHVANMETMTLQGVVFKTLICLFCVLLTAGWTWVKFAESGGNVAVVSPWIWIGAIGGFIVAIIISFKKEWAPVGAPVYALLEGLFMGGISAMFESIYPGIVLQAVGLTIGTLFSMLLVYQSGFIKVTDNFRFGVFAATGGIALFYLVTMVLSFFGVQVPLVYSNGLFGILFSLFVVGIAALNLVIDFDYIAQGANSRAPKFMEWYSSFALMVTLIWLYVEFLRLLSKLRSSN